MKDGLRILLYPFALLYGIVTCVRNRLYDWHVLKVHRFDVHTIGVGNLAVGGAGKTPLVEYLIRLLRSHDPNLATLSRGYKRKTRGFALAGPDSTAEDIGDEPLIYKTKYDVQVAVDGRRARGIKKLLQLENSPSTILLDDVLQHRSLKCGLTILVSDYNNLYVKDHLLPVGTLRETQAGSARADIIVISKTPERISAVDIRNILKDIRPRAHQKVFFSYLRYGDLYSIHNVNDKLDTLDELFRFRVIAFTGIANATPMLTYLKEYAAEVKHLPFGDHHAYSQKDLTDIERYYHSFTGGNKILVTTEKDLMRLRSPELWEIASRMNIYILPVEVTFKDKEEEFNKLITKYVSTNRIYHQKYTAANS